MSQTLNGPPLQQQKLEVPFLRLRTSQYGLEGVRKKIPLP